MSFLNFGSAKGLAYKHDFQKDVDRLYQQEAYKSKIQAEKEQKTRYYAEQMKEHTAVAPSMTRELEGHYKELNEKVANFAIENPGWETDVNLSQEFNSLTDGYLNNEFVRKDIQSQEQFAKLKDAYNNGKIKNSVWEAEMEKYNDFQENGGDGYVFANITLPTYQDILQNSNALLEPSTRVDNNGRMITNVTETDIKTVRNQAQVDFMDEDKRGVIKAEFEQYNAEGSPFRGIYHNAFDFHTQKLAMNEPTKRAYAAFDPTWKATQEAKATAQADWVETKPYFAQNIGYNFQVGKTIANHPGLASLTAFGEKNVPINLAAGTEVYIRGENGSLRKEILQGEFVLKNTNGMTIDPSHGGLIECEVRTTVNSVKKTTGKNWKVIKDGEETYMNDEQLAAFYKEEGISKGDVKGITEGDERRSNGSKYKVESYQDPENLHDVYSGLGFTSTGKVTEGIMVDFNGSKETFPTYAGTIILPANITEATLNNYEKEAGGQARANKVFEAGRTSRAGFMIENTANGNYTVATEFLNDSFKPSETKYFSSTGKPATEKNFDKKVVTGKWAKDPDYPGVYFRVNTITKDGVTQQVREGYDAQTDSFGDY